MLSAQQKFFAVKQAIDAWNPYSLLPEAPEDEFDIESWPIAERLKGGESVTTIAKIVSDVFLRAFGEERFQLENCMDVATAIHSNLSQFTA